MKVLSLFNHQIDPSKAVIDLFATKKKVVLCGCPGSGKTEMSFYINRELINNGTIKKKVLVLAHSLTILKENYKERFEEYGFDFASRVDIRIPQECKNINPDDYDFVIIDEAHENYLVKGGMVQKIIKNIPKHLLLTGTPSKLILDNMGKQRYNFVTIAMADIPREFFAKVGIEMCDSDYKWQDCDYNYGGNIKQNTKISKEDTLSAIDIVLNRIIYRLSNTILTAKEFNKGGMVAKIKAFITNNKIKKTLFIAATILQSKYIYDYLKGYGFNVGLSNSKDDNDNEIFNSFKNDDFDMLVVVNRGRIGYNDIKLYNIVDMSGTKNVDLLYQMFSRVVRGTQDMQKFFIKVVPSDYCMKDIMYIHMQMALSLMFKEVIEKFNGRNMKQFEVVFKKQKSQKNPKGLKQNIKRKVYFPNFTNDVVVELEKVRSEANSELSIYRTGNIGEIISMVNDERLPANYWTKERCHEEALKYEKRSIFSYYNNSAYDASRTNGWLDEICSHMPNTYRQVWTKESCHEEALKYKTRTEFYKKSNAYDTSRRNGWLDEICSHMSILNRHWTKEDAHIEALKYKNRSDFKKNSTNAYNCSVKNKWLDEICSHMIEIKKPNNYWTKERCHEESLKYKTRNEFRKNSISSYYYCVKNKWLDEICSHMIEIKKPNNYWTKERCHEESLKYKTRNEFRKNSGGACTISSKNGWLDEFFPKK